MGDEKQKEDEEKKDQKEKDDEHEEWMNEETKTKRGTGKVAGRAVQEHWGEIESHSGGRFHPKVGQGEVPVTVDLVVSGSEEMLIVAPTAILQMDIHGKDKASGSTCSVEIHSMYPRTYRCLYLISSSW